ncbi:glycosyltransferase family 4 protein [Marinobacter halotolerans]|uniref:glycosyltransferase family 4 protein n=1 Tax=Marinobacter halotolerans TaxID=1569211 RepID=UPI0012445497|nr:glycosyltransferase family 4 protein [Marinobacter halotolerans]
MLANTGWYINNFRRSTIDAFLARGDDVFVLCPENSGEAFLRDLPIILETFKLDGSGTDIFSELRSLLSIHTILKDICPDLVFSFNPKTNLYGLLACILLRIRCIPNVSGTGSASQIRGWKGFLYRVTVDLAYKRARSIFFQNEVDLDLFEKRGLLDKVPHLLLPGSGVNLSLFRPSNNYESTPFRFLLACRLIREKGVLEYLSAAEQVISKTDSPVEFWLAGVPDRSDRSIKDSEIKEYVDKRVVRFLGQINDMPVTISEVDCVVLPTYYPEGVPRFLLEGAAAGKVLITTDRPGCRTTVLEGKNGFFVLPRSVTSLVHVMEKVLALSDVEVQRMGHQSRQLAVEKFDERLVIEAYVNAAQSEPSQ